MNDEGGREKKTWNIFKVKEKGNLEPEGEEDNGKKEKDMRDVKVNVKRNKTERKVEDIPTKGENKITH